MAKEVYYVCEYSFNPEVRDKRDLDICLHELDFYTWSGGKHVLPHRLSLRKRISTGEYELYRSFFEPLPVSNQTETIACKSADLQIVLYAGERAWRELFESDCSPHRVCKHVSLEKSPSCQAPREEHSRSFLTEIGFHPVTSGEVYYRGVTSANRVAGDLSVWRCGDGKVEKLSPVPSQKLWNHSPDGFQWGYGGSGPAQLALALLLDASSDPEISIKHHQEFKQEFVATWQETWEISRNQILEWIKGINDKEK